MKYLLLLSLFVCGIFVADAQTIPNDTIPLGVTTVHKDPRIDILGKKMADYNAAIAYNNSRTAKGYRLMVLSTNDRDLAMKVRSQLLQQFPDQNVYMSFQSPYIKLKFGNFVEKDDAERVRKQLMNQKLVSGNIYVLPETIEVKPDKNALQDDN